MGVTGLERTALPISLGHVWGTPAGTLTAGDRVIGRRYPPPVPRLCAFHGIVIYMYVRDHGVAHFHARSGDDEGVIAVQTSEVLVGGLSPRQMRLVVEWSELHR